MGDSTFKALVPASTVLSNLSWGRESSKTDSDEIFSLAAAIHESTQRAVLQLRLRDWFGMASAAYAPNTLRAWRSDWNAFVEFGRRSLSSVLPSTPETVRAFLLDQADRGSSVATLRRLRSTISRAHIAADLPDPTKSESVRLALRECARTLGSRQRQARGLLWQEIETYLRRPVHGPRDHRDRALVCIAYDGSLRSEELVDIEFEHLTLSPAGPGTLLIPSSKTDQEGEGSFVAIAPRTVHLLNTWFTCARIQSGPIFRRVLGYAAIEERLTTQSVGDVFQRIGKMIDLPKQEWQQLSGHSARVGSTQDLFAANMELSAIMQQGRWKDPRMAIRYGERLLAARGAMMQLAKQQGRWRTAAPDERSAMVEPDLQPESPILIFADSIAATPFRIAPERGEELREIAENGRLHIQFRTDTRKISVASGTGRITLGIVALEHLWASALYYHCLYSDYAAAQRQRQSQFDPTAWPRTNEALHLLNWTLRKYRANSSEPWPLEYPCPRLETDQRSDIYVANELFHFAIAWTLHHEIAHVRHAHPLLDTCRSQAEEKEADVSAVDWILGKVSEEKELRRRVLGVVVGILALDCLDFIKRDPRATTHPKAYERLAYSMLQYGAEADDEAFAFALCGMQFNCAQRGVVPPKDGSTFRALLDELFLARHRYTHTTA